MIPKIHFHPSRAIVASSATLAEKEDTINSHLLGIGSVDNTVILELLSPGTQVSAYPETTKGATVIPFHSWDAKPESSVTDTSFLPHRNRPKLCLQHVRPCSDPLPGEPAWLII